ncbi:glutamic-oxaloacetic transaminase 1, soluble, partial [Caulochytrium protostelioides]
IFEDAGFAVQTYPYWDAAARGLDIDGLLAVLRAAAPQSIIVLHACAHNPTGVDPTAAQWRQIAEVCRERAHFPFFDCAYQGFASGSLDRDAAAVRAFVADGFELFVAQSYSKNFGLYGERVGCLTVVAHEPAVAQHIESQLAKITRAMISNPPSHGARIVSRVITDAGLMAQWQRELETMAGRIRAMRQALFTHLQQLGTPGTWQHIVDQIGMFSYTGLSPAQCQTLIDQHHVYLSSNGRISMAGLNEGNVERFARAVDQVVRQS